jgi:glycerol-3-phosphate dehydrogenase (NAD(P)+)
VGLGLAAGKKPAEISAEMRMVAEGVSTTGAAVALGEELGVELPVASCVRSLLEGEVSAAEAVNLLMIRDLKEEYPL